MIFSGARRRELEKRNPTNSSRRDHFDSMLTKTITIGGDQEIILYSIDAGQSWSSDLSQLRERERRLQKERDAVCAYAKRIFKKSYLSNI